MLCRDELRIASPRLLPGNSYKHLDDARVGRGHVTVSAVPSRISTMTQQLKHCWKECFPHVRSRVYRTDWSSFTSSSWWETAVGSSRVVSSHPVKTLYAIVPSRPALGFTQPPIKWVPGVKRQGREADHSPLTSAEVKKMWIYASTPLYVLMA
jgi:hypothetical protein